MQFTAESAVVIRDNSILQRRGISLSAVLLHPGIEGRKAEWQAVFEDKLGAARRHGALPLPFALKRMIGHWLLRCLGPAGLSEPAGKMRSGNKRNLTFSQYFFFCFSGGKGCASRRGYGQGRSPGRLPRRWRRHRQPSEALFGRTMA